MILIKEPERMEERMCFISYLKKRQLKKKKVFSWFWQRNIGERIIYRSRLFSAIRNKLISRTLEHINQNQVNKHRTENKKKEESI